MIPIIYTFASTNAPEPESCLAFFYERVKDKKGNLFDRRLPMVFAAATKEGARKSAEDWWTKEQAKIAERADRIDAMRKARAKEPT